MQRLNDSANHKQMQRLYGDGRKTFEQTQRGNYPILRREVVGFENDPETRSCSQTLRGQTQIRGRMVLLYNASLNAGLWKSQNTQKQLAINRTGMPQTCHTADHQNG